MEIKAQLNKPYSDKQRMDFIVEYNHQQGYEIQETDEALLAVYNEPTIEEQNEAIRLQRRARFQQEADPLKYDYEEALANENENVEELKHAWLNKKAQIREELPYVEEDK